MYFAVYKWYFLNEVLKCHLHFFLILMNSPLTIYAKIFSVTCWLTNQLEQCRSQLLVLNGSFKRVTFLLMFPIERSTNSVWAKLIFQELYSIKYYIKKRWVLKSRSCTFKAFCFPMVTVLGKSSITMIISESILLT